MADALIDTNVFIHAEANDEQTAECRALLDALKAGTQSAVLDPIVVHELTYAWPRYIRGASKQDIADYVLEILAMYGIVGDKELLQRVVRRWRATTAGFVDRLLTERALSDNVPVYTKNVRDFQGEGVEVPDPLPH
jgi:predicted nucleic acid-binding protein